MTCLVALAHGRRVHLGADSLLTDNGSTHLIGGSKFIRVGPAVLAWCGVLGDVQEFARGLRGAKSLECLRRGELPPEIHARIKWAELDKFEAGFILAVPGGRFWTIDGSLAVCPHGEGYAALGSGDGPAMGVLYALRRSRLSPKAKLKAALSAAEHHASGVRRPFRFASV